MQDDALTRAAPLAAPASPDRRLHLGVTGHRVDHPGFEANAQRVEAALAEILAIIEGALESLPSEPGAGAMAPIRFHGLLADGADRMAADMALAHGYELVAPLPFGRRLNKAINALPRNGDDARALLAGDSASDPVTQGHADAIRRLSDQARLFCLADRDAAIADLFLAKLDHPDDTSRAQHFIAEASRRVALAGRILIEQSDIMIGVWDGASTAHVGGTGHTIAAALNLGSPVVWINTANPEHWRILIGPESLLAEDVGDAEARPDLLSDLVRSFLHPKSDTDHPGLATLALEKWHARSNRFTHAYRRVETLFAGRSDRSRLRSLVQHYASPDDREGLDSDPLVAATRQLPDVDHRHSDQITKQITGRFRWADGVSAHLSDAYRGGMIVSFILSSLAIVGGVAYLPLVPADQKWGFALFELVLLCSILVMTALGQRRRWHGRWFETRRLAEYLRHGTILLALGSARAPGRWPVGAETSWPEFYARQTLRSVGLPQAAITTAYLRGVLTGLLDPHVTEQRDYHFDKARRLTTVHHNLDRLSERLFQLAVASVGLYLLLVAGVALDIVPRAPVAHTSKIFTVLGVLFPTFGAGIAGIRYFGDFERFAAISEVTAEKLDRVHARIMRLAAASDAALHYGSVADLAHATDDIVFAEIENWQAVFGSKQISVPV